MCHNVEVDGETQTVDLRIHRSRVCPKEGNNKYENCSKNIDETDSMSCVTTATNGDVRMVSRCPSDFSERAEPFRRFCQDYYPNAAHDLWLMTPVTDFKSNTTYKNVFCAACHQVDVNDVNFWELRLSCTHKETGDLLRETFETKTPPANNIFRSLHSWSSGIWKYAMLNQNSYYDEYLCFFHAIAAENSNILSSCDHQSGNPRVKPSHCIHHTENPALTSPAQTSSPEPARSTNASNNSSGGPADDLPRIVLPRNLNCFPLNVNISSLSLKLNYNDQKYLNPKFVSCEQIQPTWNTNLYDILCSQPKGKANKCKLNLVNYRESKEDNASEIQFSTSKLEGRECFKIIRPKHSNDSYVCVLPEAPARITPESFFSYFLKVLQFILMCLMVGLILYLLIFVGLPEKSTLDKNLAILGYTLLIQILCVTYYPKKRRHLCGIFAIVWHYSLLSCFTWILILSYDCWLRVYQSFERYQLVSDVDKMQFLLYCVLSQAIPMVVTSAAFCFARSPADVYCQQQLALDRYECLIANVPGFWLFFIIPASILFVSNIYFLVRLGCSVFLQRPHLKQVRQKFKERSGLTMMMSPAWMLSSLAMFSHYELPVGDILICVVHILQGVFFLVFAFIHMLDRILQKYDEIESKIFGNLQNFPGTTSSISPQDREFFAVLEGRRAK